MLQVISTLQRVALGLHRGAGPGGVGWDAEAGQRENAWGGEWRPPLVAKEEGA